MRLPLEEKNFETLRKKNCYYVDKTRYIYDLTLHRYDYFLSRPRRFGKSLFVSTLQSLFEGKKELFEGLYIYDKWDWSQKYPVIRISFGGKEYTNENDLEKRIFSILDSLEQKYNIVASEELKASDAERLLNILEHIYTISSKTKVVILIDEYDKPLLDALANKELSEKNESTLRGFYGIFKQAGKHIHFIFVTGITMISKFSIFTYLYLIDISLEPEFSTICGYTDKDLDTVFKEELKDFDRKKIRTWYNGYSWLGEEKIYNPHGILKLFFNKEFKSWWPEDGTPHYLFYYLIKKRALPLQLENSLILGNDLIRFSMNSGKIEALYFQLGFLTIQEKLYKGDDIYYRLDYPNLEARKSFHHGLMAYITQGQVDDEYKSELTEYLKNNDFKKFCEYLHNKLCGVSGYWNMMPNERFFFNYESCYSLFLYASLHSPNLQMIPEQPSKAGRRDLTVFYEKQVFIFELKVAKNARELKKALDSAMDQIKKRGYGESYKDSEQPIHFIALAFSREERNVIGWRHEMLS